MSSDRQDEASRLGGLNSLCTQTGWLWSSALLTFGSWRSTSSQGMCNHQATVGLQRLG